MKYREVKEIFEKYSNSNNLLIIGKKTNSTEKGSALRDRNSNIPIIGDVYRENENMDNRSSE